MHASATAVLLCFVTAVAIATTDVSTAYIGLAWRADARAFYNVKCAYDVALQEINANATLLPHTELKFRELASNCDASTALNVAQQAVEYNLNCSSPYSSGPEGPTLAIVGASCSTSSVALAEIMNYRYTVLLQCLSSCPLYDTLTAATYGIVDAVSLVRL